MTSAQTPICRIIAGPNGAGKTTFALTYLRQFPEAQSFVNADLIAAGLSPLAPQQQLLAASRLMLRESMRTCGPAAPSPLRPRFQGAATCS